MPDHVLAAVCPGPVETEMAELVGFLCSPAASFINGQSIANDGGFDASGMGIPTFRRNAGINAVGDEGH
jgi:meso-butanediol dehydrogenase / (S,S)-butanediol dehydrogenase / diacetyl reductase